jgi:hypothetical protein
VNTLFPDTYSGTFFLDQLITIPEGTDLFEIYGMTAPVEMNGQSVYIGLLQTTSAMITSNWGDKSYFVQHHNLAEDFLLEPEWAQFTPSNVLTTSNSDQERKTYHGCPFAHLWQ